jgi:hypothetical protein
MSNPLQVLHVTDVSAMGYVAEEYKYTSASGLVSENKELVPGDHPAVTGQYASPSLSFFRNPNFIRPFSSFRHQQPPPPLFPSLFSAGAGTKVQLHLKSQIAFLTPIPAALRHHWRYFHCVRPARRVHVTRALILTPHLLQPQHVLL